MSLLDHAERFSPFFQIASPRPAAYYTSLALWSCLFCLVLRPHPKTGPRLHLSLVDHEFNAAHIPHNTRQLCRKSYTLISYRTANPVMLIPYSSYFSLHLPELKTWTPLMNSIPLPCVDPLSRGSHFFPSNLPFSLPLASPATPGFFSFLYP